MPAIASLEDLKSAQKEGLGTYAMCYVSLQSRTRDTSHGYDLNEKWRRIGWKNICKLWLQEGTPEELKGERDGVRG
jgi:hypothetical protein